MPKRVLDFDALWASDKIASLPVWAQAEYAWLYGLADASGSFEMTNLRVIWGRVAAIRKSLTLERLEQVFQEFGARGLLFTWDAGGKRYGHWTGSDVPGRLPPPSWRARLEKLAPPVPKQHLAAYVAQFATGSGAWTEKDAGESRDGFAGLGFGERRAGKSACATGTCGGVGDEPTVPEPQVGTAAASSEQLKLCLEEAQGQEWGWDKDWNKEKEKTNTKEGVTACFETAHAQESQVKQSTKHFAEELLEIYERERGSLPAALKMTPERRRQCAFRKRAGLRREEFAEAVRRAAATPFLSGEGARGWRASFDWFIASDTNVRKVIEGVYDSGQRRDAAADGAAVNTRERAVHSELRVGSGPVAADYGVRVRPEVLERIRAREAARSGP